MICHIDTYLHISQSNQRLAGGIMRSPAWTRISNDSLPLHDMPEDQLSSKTLRIKIKVDNDYTTILVSNLTLIPADQVGASCFKTWEAATGMDAFIRYSQNVWEIRWPEFEFFDGEIACNWPVSSSKAALTQRKTSTPTEQGIFALTDSNMAGLCFLYAMATACMFILFVFEGSWRGAVVFGYAAAISEAFTGFMLIVFQLGHASFMKLRLSSCLLVLGCGAITLLISVLLSKT
jgi:hypothetical protein